MLALLRERGDLGCLPDRVLVLAAGPASEDGEGERGPLAAENQGVDGKVQRDRGEAQDGVIAPGFGGVETGP